MIRCEDAIKTTVFIEALAELGDFSGNAFGGATSMRPEMRFN